MLHVSTQAAQALEPAALVALRLLAAGGTCVLVGDPQQLPATVLSRAAEAGHLTQSMFERLQRVSCMLPINREPEGAPSCCTTIIASLMS